MQLQQPKTIFLSDYRPSDFLIDSIELTVDIHDDYTLIHSLLKIEKQESARGKKLNLELNGENMELLDLKFNGEVVPADRYQLSNDKLVILNIEHDKFVLEIQNKIDPANNKALEGFYQSGPQLCTQCEPEGFRKITYFIDRPDVMAKYKTKMIASKKKYPFLLSNGNRIESGDLADGRHWVLWEDPFRKPSYLFAMVGGDFDVARDTFTTRSGRKVDLEIYVDKGNLGKTRHAMESLKQSMKWDEETFGLEYDLDIYMIVAVDSFNMGAMENKGLNIFNSTYTLADETSATDMDFQNIQGVIGHEYFHNWTGNRVTCRDWFQLTLKEGLTVFRDQEFSSDMLSRAVKRLEDVRMLKDSQFAEDAGPLGHPIRPSSYIEINNFYTRTVYEKGAEVIRMIHTLIGKENFRKGMDKYFELHDGKAVTTEDFVDAMSQASGKDLSQFKNWYSRSGTPTLVVRMKKEGSGVEMDIEQKYPPTTHKVPEGNILHMPLVIGFIDRKTGNIEEHHLEIKKIKETFRFPISGDVIPSLNRGFSAPVHIDYPFDTADLITLMSFDNDPYSKYEATQKIYDHILKAEFNQYKASGALTSDLQGDFKTAFENLLKDESIDLSFKSYLLDLPTENQLSQEMIHPDFDGIHLVHRNLKKKLGLTFQDWFLTEHKRLNQNGKFELTPQAFGERALRNQCLTYLVASGTNEGMKALEDHYFKASNMTEEVVGLQQYIMSGVSLEHEAIQKFYQKWQHDSLVMLKWFGSLASCSPKTDAIKRLEILEKDPLFQNQVPNYLRALYLQFSKNNLDSFHDVSGKGYHFIAERIKHIDSFNPQVASRGASAFSLITKLDETRQKEMRSALNKIMEGKPSRDTYELISKYLAQ
ncbi:MAG: aminopeptidase N [Bacteriovoracia bacterium]